MVFPRVVINYEDDECRGTTSLATPILLEWPLIQGDDGPTRSDLLGALTDRRHGGQRWRRGEGQK
ncbi:MAG: hypothetical protein IT190_00140 [Microbacteriaceae bacterium]|nr:hypothetical protein [Microbacteriaceae bacterium]